VVPVVSRTDDRIVGRYGQDRDEVVETDPRRRQSNAKFLAPVTVGVPATLTAWAKGRGTVQPYVQFYDVNWATLGSATAPSFTLSPTAFTQWSFTYTAPVGTGIVQVAFQNLM
jgi:hypothetical protein